MSAPDDDAVAADFIRAVIEPKAALGARRELGMTALARQLDLPDHQLGGHWCGRCEGVWYGCLLEVECPRCGNRHG